jgi:hypothetical protein
VPAEALAQGRPPIPGAAAHHAYLALFTDSLNDLFLVGAVIAFAGAIGAFALVRQRDFIASQAAARPAPEAAAEPEAA